MSIKFSPLKILVRYDMVIYAPPEELMMIAERNTKHTIHYTLIVNKKPILIKGHISERHLSDVKLDKAWLNLRETCRDSTCTNDKIIEAIEEFDRLLEKNIDKQASNIIGSIFYTEKKFGNKTFLERVKLYPARILFYGDGDDSSNSKALLHFSNKIFSEDHSTRLNIIRAKSETISLLQDVMKYLYRTYPRPIVDWLASKCSGMREVLGMLYNLYEV